MSASPCRGGSASRRAPAPAWPCADVRDLLASEQASLAPRKIWDLRCCAGFGACPLRAPAVSACPRKPGPLRPAPPEEPDLRRAPTPQGLGAAMAKKQRTEPSSVPALRSPAGVPWRPCTGRAGLILHPSCSTSFQVSRSASGERNCKAPKLPIGGVPAKVSDSQHSIPREHSPHKRRRLNAAEERKLGPPVAGFTHASLCKRRRLSDAIGHTQALAGMRRWFFRRITLGDLNFT